MTIKHLWDEAMPGVKRKPTVSFNVAKNKRIAIDVNCWLCGSCTKTPNAMSLTFAPPCTPTDLINILSSWNNALLKHNMTPCCVFDDCRHPIKRNTN